MNIFLPHVLALIYSNTLIIQKSVNETYADILHSAK